MVKPVQLAGLPITRLPQPVDGPAGMPDRRKWRQPRILLVDGPGGLNSGAGRSFDSKSGEVEVIPRDYLALRWPDGWKLVEHWRPEREGILCVLEQGGSIWVDSAQSLMATGEVPI